MLNIKNVYILLTFKTNIQLQCVCLDLGKGVKVISLRFRN